MQIPIEDLCVNFADAMGWDNLGRPLPKRLRALGLNTVAGELESMDK